MRPKDVEARLDEAASVIRRLPEKGWPQGYANVWPGILSEALEGDPDDTQRRFRVPPSPASITRAEEAFGWLAIVPDPVDRRLVWMRAENHRWKFICNRCGISRATAWRRWATAIILLGKSLDLALAKSQKSAVSSQPPRRAVSSEGV
jgi:Domain of unknown function (DUF6362)